MAAVYVAGCLIHLGSDALVLPQSDVAIDNVLKHGVNNFIILLDVLLSRQPFVSYHYQVRQ